MKVLIIGSGAREHAILKAVLKSPLTSKVFVAPGNAGMALDAECVAIPAQNIERLIAFVQQNGVDLTIVGPEMPLTLGIVDEFRERGLKILGPDKKAAILEASKVFTKEFCRRHKIPTANFEVFEESQKAKDYIRERGQFPVVIKADGLAAGKGVVIATTQSEADAALADMLVYEKFGAAGRKVIVEEFVTGAEASFIVLCDGENFIEFPASQDHKRIFDNDAGPNTGGMGAYAPAPILTEALRKKAIEQIIKPTLAGMKAEGREFTGFLYAGLMITSSGDLSLLEYNCRLGDPETEVLLPLLKSDFVELSLAAVDGKLYGLKPEFLKASAVCVVLTSRGYPGEYETGQSISGLDRVSDAQVYHAGTKLVDGNIVSHGGRVLCVTTVADTLSEAIEKVYKNLKPISFDGMHYRKDIGKKGL